LEFPYVYIVGLEENLFPGIQSLSTREDLEEERRLFYVALTRAETKLILSYAESRYRWGNITISEPSRFIDEIDPELIERTKKASFRGTTIKEDRSYNPFSGRGAWTYSGDKRYEKPREESPSYPKASPSDFVPVDADEIQAGMRVLHQKFGQGTVVKVEGLGPNKKASVDFDDSGNKMLMLKFAKLSILKQ